MTTVTYWHSRALFERALAVIYFVAFLVAANQFVPLLGEHGLLPVSRFVQYVSFQYVPSLFFFAHSDGVFRVAAWLGVALSVATFVRWPQRFGTLPAAAVWGTMWLLYLSFVNVGQIFYGFGWETLLLEVGFLAIFLGGARTEPSRILTWLQRWVLFRLMFGAGLIKLRGDECWRNLTCLDYYFETQPMPNPLSWYFHWLPAGVHHAGVAINHFVEVLVPFAYFAPPAIAAPAGVITVLFQLTLIVSGNLSWLNWLTIVLAISTIDDRWLRWMPEVTPELKLGPTTARRFVLYGLAAVVVFLSIAPVMNLLSSQQMMNSSFDPLHLVNTYGAFGTVTERRDEIVLEGTADEEVTERTVWREYEVRGKPGDPNQMPPIIAPYHLRLGWLLWFAAMELPQDHSEWFNPFIVKLLQGDAETLSLLRVNPFPGGPPRFIRAELFRYRFTTPAEHRQTAAWWIREPVGFYLPPVSSASLVVPLR